MKIIAGQVTFSQEEARSMYDALQRIVQLDGGRDGVHDEWTEALAFCEAQMIASLTIDSLEKKEM